METYRNNKYTITTSLSDRHIIINITNNVSYACYEGKYENSAFRLSFDNTAIFKLVNKCFAEFVEPTGKSTYKVVIALSDNTGADHLVLDFDCVVEGFLAVAFKLRMVEKTASGGSDKGLIIELNQQKQLVSELTERIAEMESADQETVDIIAGQQHSIDTLMKRMADMEKTLNSAKRECEKIPEIERRIECMGSAIMVEFKYNSHNQFIKHELSSTKLRIVCSSYNGGFVENALKQIKYFYKLEELSLSGDRVWSDIRNHSEPDKNIIISNSVLKKLHIDDSSTWSDLTILRQFPKLEEFHGGGGNLNANALENLKLIPHKLKKISLTGVSNANMLQSYCDKNGIELVIA
jgi:hypothetical protein